MTGVPREEDMDAEIATTNSVASLPPQHQPPASTAQDVENNNHDHEISGTNHTWEKEEEAEVGAVENDPDEDSYCDGDLSSTSFRLSPPDAQSDDMIRHREIIANSIPRTELELALHAEYTRLLKANAILTSECVKLRRFMTKRKQTYKRKRKDESAPRKKLSGYNLFVRERFAQLARENEDALKSADNAADLKRIPPSRNIASSGKAWSMLSAEEKARYNDMAKPDEDRFEKECATYQAPGRSNTNCNRNNKTGYDLYFSEYVQKLKSSEDEEGSLITGSVEHGSIAQLVTDAWEQTSTEERDRYEHNAKELNATQNVQGHHHQLSKSQDSNDLRCVSSSTSDSNEQHSHAAVDSTTTEGVPLQQHSNIMSSVPAGIPPPYPNDAYGGSGGYGPMPPVLHQPMGYDCFGGMPPPFDVFGYPYNPMQSMLPPGMPPPPPPFGPPPPLNFQGPTHPPPPHPYMNFHETG